MDPRQVNRFDHRHGFGCIYSAGAAALGIVQYNRYRDVWLLVLTASLFVCTMLLAGMYRADMREQRRENEKLIAEIETTTKMDPREINKFDYTVICLTAFSYSFVIGGTGAFMIHGLTWMFLGWIAYAVVAMWVWYDQAKRDWEAQVQRNEELIRAIEAAITKI